VKKSAHQLDREVAAILGRRPILARRATGASSMHFHPIGRAGEPWPAWLRELGKACGVYAIKEHGRVVYVGSSRKALYGTITRHFQQWKRSKNWWKGQYGAGHDPGLVYDRGACAVWVATAACGAELDEEARLIEQLRPRDNLVEHPDGKELEDAPF